MKDGGRDLSQDGRSPETPSVLGRLLSACCYEVWQQNLKKSTPLVPKSSNWIEPELVHPSIRPSSSQYISLIKGKVFPVF